MNIGKTKISVMARGCVKCGTEHAEGWATYRVIIIIVGDNPAELAIPICSDCKRKIEPLSAADK